MELASGVFPAEARSAYCACDHEALISKLVCDAGIPHRRRIAPSGTLIITPGDATEYLFVLESGLCVVTSEYADGTDSAIALLVRGDVCCYAHAILRGQYGFAVRAITQAVVVRIRKIDLLNLVGSSDLVGLECQRNMTEGFERALQFCSCIAAPTVALRLERFLEFATGLPPDALPLPQSTLARLLAVSREQLRRALNVMEIERATLLIRRRKRI